MILTKEFNLKPFIYSATATRLKIVNIPTPEAENNLRELYNNLLLPLMDMLEGSFNVSSGYRCDKLNAKIKGVPGSQHTKGQAADIEYIEDGKENNEVLFQAVQQSGLEYDQCIDEHGRWIHLSYNKGHNRKQAFRIK